MHNSSLTGIVGEGYTLGINLEFKKIMGFNDAPGLNKHDPLGIEAHEKERDVREEKIKAKLKNLHIHEMDAILVLIDGFEAQSK